MPTIEYLTPESLAERRAALLNEAGLSLEELRARDAAGTLDADAHAVLGELEDLEYLVSAA